MSAILIVQPPSAASRLGAQRRRSLVGGQLEVRPWRDFVRAASREAPGFCFRL